MAVRRTKLCSCRLTAVCQARKLPPRPWSSSGCGMSRAFPAPCPAPPIQGLSRKPRHPTCEAGVPQCGVRVRPPWIHPRGAVARPPAKTSPARCLLSDRGRAARGRRVRGRRGLFASPERPASETFVWTPHRGGMSRELWRRLKTARPFFLISGPNVLQVRALSLSELQVSARGSCAAGQIESSVTVPGRTGCPGA